MGSGSPEKRSIVLDSFAMLSFLYGEPGASRVQDVLREATHHEVRVLMSVISLGEIAYTIERRTGLPAVHAALSATQSLPLEVVVANRAAVLAAAHIKAQYPISYADAFVVAAALNRKGIVLTGDPEFRSVEQLVPVEWLAV
ncbi:MAG: type II toxin-antitoxin system VapC family toxin [Actinobacteria bacterium]|nr:type II toxin-antitoxin system VapC family toxin [Actinomycetota bacterium]